MSHPICPLVILRHYPLLALHLLCCSSTSKHLAWNANVQLANIYERNVFTVPRITLRQIGQSESDFAHASQHTKCPQGRNTVLVSRSMHILHVLASFSLRFSSFSSSCCAASCAVHSGSCLSVAVSCDAAEVATLVDILPSERHTHMRT